MRLDSQSRLNLKITPPRAVVPLRVTLQPRLRTKLKLKMMPEKHSKLKIPNLLIKMLRRMRISKLSATKLRTGQSREPVDGYLSL